MQLNITITSPDETPDGGWFAALHEDGPFTYDPPAHEAYGTTPQEALETLISSVNVNDAVAADYGIDPTLTGIPAVTYRCANCGSADVQQHAWLPLNGSVNLATVEIIDEGHTWCGTCQTNDVKIVAIDNKTGKAL